MDNPTLPVPFQQAMQFVLKWEGGYVNDPKDPGGETNYGISKRSHPSVDILHLTLPEALMIYLRDYWNFYKLDSIPSPLCIAMMDAYVQHRPTVVARFRSRAEGDWKLFNTARREFYLALVNKDPEKFKRFQRGWLNRINDLDKYCQILADKEQ